MIGIIISIISIIISIIVIIDVKKTSTRRASDEIQQYKENEFQKEREKYIKKLETEFDATKAKKYQELESLNNEIIRRNELFEIDKKTKEQLLKATLEAKREEGMTRVNREVDNWAASMQESANWEKDRILNENKKIYDASKKELELVLEEVKEYKEKRDAINQEILRARALEEKQDFYCIQLPESSKEDINFLLSITNRLNNKEVIYKLIWSEYIQKPFKSMMNRVLSGRDPKNVIYMIKNMDTNEIYIGKTKAEVSKRWTEHIKTSLNIGTISRTNIHKALFNNWDKFAFTILEEVPMESNLNEREKYYIKFYESDIFGYNIKSGG